MYAGFNLTGLENDAEIASQYRGLGEEWLAAGRTQVRRKLKELVLEGTTIPDGTAIQEEWFPQINADIFISHSHKDVDLAKGLASWLGRNFGLRCFIDSTVWGYADNLLEEINSQYSDKYTNSSGGILYDHPKCIVASKHVDTMLTIALHQMIDRCECVFLLNTENSIQRYADLPHDNTYSPWIYSELVCSRLIRKRPLSDYRMEALLEHGQQRFDASEYLPSYQVVTKHLAPVSASELHRWLAEYRKVRCKHPLDLLYKLTPTLNVEEL